MIYKIYHFWYRFFQQVQQFSETKVDKGEHDVLPVKIEKAKQKQSFTTEPEQLEYTDCIGDLFTINSS